MAISGNSNISPSGPDKWDPAIMGKQPESLSGPKESIFSETQEASSRKQEAMIQSGATANYETDLQINEGKYRKTQEKASSSPKSKLRGSFSKVRASIQGFLSGFGTRASRVSARKAEAGGEGRSMLPSDMEMVGKKGNRISPEMQGFYLDASGISDTSSDVSKLSLESLRSTSLGSLSGLREDISAAETSSIASFGSFQTARTPITESTVTAWTVNRLGGEMISTILDPNIETSSLLRRASLVGNEGMVDLSDLENRSLSTDTRAENTSKNTKIIDSGRDAGKLEEVDLEGSGILETATKEAEKKESREDLIKDQLALAKMMESLLASGAPSSVYVPLGATWSGGSTNFPAPKFSGTVIHSYNDKPQHSPIGISSNQGHTNFSSPHISGNMVKVSPTFTEHSEKPYRFPLHPSSDDRVPDLTDEGAVSFSALSDVDPVFSPVSEENPVPRYNPSAGAMGFDTVSSAYLFSSHQGMSLLAPLPRSLSEYKHEVEKRKGPGAPPDPLIYQYRNVAIDPPLIFRSPQPFASSSRLGVQGKPEAASVHDDGGGSGGGFSGQNRDQDNRRFSGGDEKSKSKELG
ncbi:hypothetical protein [Chlamydia caviae]|uniref:Uncharacterized protein n=1 Tax=Chlamydia caviae (strain ATCC VR-813 / DSM 19441 / 03DC25 / GPIC) TaxID=227941 RepID=Q823F9_CHLCV|nr:hypothetical protein [Chlamydia caviae]AAP05197.1 conserved hypothetical protein [Chlamydia caviae GPIC]